jgi:Leucine-rich repeat (LRR) protein
MENLKHLKKLILDNTGIKKLPAFIGNMHALELLEIDTWNTIEVPQCILDLPKLKRIETRGTKLSHLPSLVKKQHELDKKEFLRRIEHCRKNKQKKLNMSFLYIGKLPKELSSLHWLEKLDLSCNDLKQLPSWISNLKNLTLLDLGSNELTSLPDSIGNLKKLKIIVLSFNKLHTLPESFGNLSSLEDLTLIERCHHPALEKKYGKSSWFTCLPDSFGSLSSLKNIYISSTRLKKLPESFGNLLSLRSLNIYSDVHNPKSFYPISMRNLILLKEISINGFTQVPDFIAELKQLTSLDISHNKLLKLPDFIGNLTKLKILNLHSTWITELPSWIVNLKNLVDLDITSNDIIEDPKIKKKLPKLKKYYDDYNPFKFKE